MAHEVKVNGEEGVPTRIPIHFIKDPSHQTYHADGASGSATPHGKFCFSLYSDRRPIPQMVPLIITGANDAKEAHGEAHSKDGIVRSIHASFICDLEVAEVIGKWLVKAVGDIRAAQLKVEKARRERKPE